MIKAITVTTPKGESLKLTLANPEESGLIVKSIEGLGPSKANINTTELAEEKCTRPNRKKTFMSK